MKCELADGVVLYLGDAYEILPTLEERGVIVADPPYAFNASGGGKFRKARKAMNAIARSGLAKGFDHTILSPELSAGGVVCFCHNDQIPVLSAWFAEQFDRFALCAWHKPNPIPFANKHYLADTEFYFHAWNKGFHPVGAYADLSRSQTVFGRPQHGHPTEKPLPVMEKILRNVASPLIVDPFMGVGSTGVAAVRAGRRFIGIEMDERWFEIAAQRIAKEIDALRVSYADRAQQSEREAGGSTLQERSTIS